MTGDTHYDLEILAELAEGLLDDGTARRVREHLAICDPCGESLADLAAVREMLAAMPVPAMPLGVTLRLDRALAAEPPLELLVGAEPGWDAFVPGSFAPDELADARGAFARDEVSAIAREEVAPAETPLGVVDADGQVVPSRRTTRQGKRAGRRWAMPLSAAAAAVVVVGGAGLVTSILSGGTQRSFVLSEAQPSTAPTKVLTIKPARSYTVYASAHNYTSRELSGPLLGYFGVAPGSGTSDDQGLDRCVQRYSTQLDRRPIGVDKAFYNGNEATIMAFWEDQKINAVRVVVVDSACHSLRPEGLATWN